MHSGKLPSTVIVEIQSFSLQRAFSSQNVMIPLSALIPAPVNTTIFIFLSSINQLGNSISIFSLFCSSIPVSPSIPSLLQLNITTDTESSTALHRKARESYSIGVTRLSASLSNTPHMSSSYTISYLDSGVSLLYKNKNFLYHILVGLVLILFPFTSIINTALVTIQEPRQLSQHLPCH